MDGYSIAGLPLHILIVHVAVILIPAAALVVLVAALWPRFRRWLGLVTPILAVVAAAIVPLVTQAGAWLEDRVPDAPLIERHAAVGDTLWPWTLSLGILGVVEYAWFRFVDRRAGSATPARGVRTAVAIVLAAAAAVIGAGTVITTIIVGESGSRAVWEGSFSDTPLEK